MKTRMHERKFTLKEALCAFSATLGLLALCTFGAEAQVKDQAGDDAGTDRKEAGAPHHGGRVIAFTRPGYPKDVRTNGRVIPAGYQVDKDGKWSVNAAGPQAKLLKAGKLPILGGTVYYAVLENLYRDGDTFGTGLPDFDRRFNYGRSSVSGYDSPAFKKDAKYLYLYQVVNDRTLDPRDRLSDENRIKAPIGGEDKALPKGKVDDKVQMKMVADASTNVPATEDIASFALQLRVDPRYISSWGYFNEAGFASKVVDKNVAGARQMEAGGEDKKIRLAVSHMPAILGAFPDPNHLEAKLVDEDHKDDDEAAEYLRYYGQERKVHSTSISRGRAYYWTLHLDPRNTDKERQDTLAIRRLEKLPLYKQNTKIAEAFKREVADFREFAENFGTGGRTTQSVDGKKEKAPVGMLLTAAFGPLKKAADETKFASLQNRVSASIAAIKPETVEIMYDPNDLRDFASGTNLFADNITRVVFANWKVNSVKEGQHRRHLRLHVGSRLGRSPDPHRHERRSVGRRKSGTR